MERPAGDESATGAMPAVGDSYAAAIRTAAGAPQQLEQLYQSAQRTRTERQFTIDMLAAYASAPENVLYGAWFYRLQQPAAEGGRRSRVDWDYAVPMSILLGLIFWALSDARWTFAGYVPYILFLWSPITALFLIAFVSLAARRFTPAVAVGAIAVVVGAVYIYLMVTARLSQDEARQQTYLTLMLLHLPLLGWGALGLAVLGWHSSAGDRFGFLSKSIEAIGTAGVYAIAGGIFAGLTFAMFAVLGITDELLVRLLIAGIAGVIPVIAVASVYDARLAPSQQDFRRGFGKILSILMQALLPLTLLVLVIYIVAIPFNFAEPFATREVLIVYNVVLFAIMGLLIGVTPMSDHDFSAGYQRALRAGIVAVAGLMLVVSLYALTAILYRTVQDGLTMNRVTVVGWNVVNIGLLVALLVGQLLVRRSGRWIEALHGTARIGTVAYMLWGVAVIALLPWIF